MLSNGITIGKGVVMVAGYIVQIVGGNERFMRGSDQKKRLQSDFESSLPEELGTVSEYNYDDVDMFPNWLTCLAGKTQAFTRPNFHTSSQPDSETVDVSHER